MAVRDLGAPADGGPRGAQLVIADPPTGQPFVAVAAQILTAPGGYPSVTWGRDGFATFAADPAQARSGGATIWPWQPTSSRSRWSPAPTGWPVPDPATVRATVEAAHSAGLRVVAHALRADMVRTRGGRRGRRARPYADRAAAARTRRNGIAAARIGVVSTAADVLLWRQWDRGVQQNAADLVQAGVTLRYGTDLGNTGTQPRRGSARAGPARRRRGWGGSARCERPPRRPRRHPGFGAALVLLRPGESAALVHAARAIRCRSLACGAPSSPSWPTAGCSCPPPRRSLRGWTSWTGPGSVRTTKSLRREGSAVSRVRPGGEAVTTPPQRTDPTGLVWAGGHRPPSDRHPRRHRLPTPAPWADRPAFCAVGRRPAAAEIPTATPPPPAHPWLTRRELRAVGLVVLALIVVGVLAGVVWQAWTVRTQGFDIGSGVIIPDETEGWVGADAHFRIITGIVGLIAGFLAWRWRTARGPAMVLALTIGGVAREPGRGLGRYLTGGGNHTVVANTNVVRQLPLSVQMTGLFLVQAIAALVKVVSRGGTCLGLG